MPGSPKCQSLKCLWNSISCLIYYSRICINMLSLLQIPISTSNLNISLYNHKPKKCFLIYFLIYLFFKGEFINDHAQWSLETIEFSSSKSGCSLHWLANSWCPPKYWGNLDPPSTTLYCFNPLYVLCRLITSLIFYDLYLLKSGCSPLGILSKSGWSPLKNGYPPLKALKASIPLPQ